jgi:hypothetical protein
MASANLKQDPDLFEGQSYFISSTGPVAKAELANRAAKAKNK